MRICLLSDASDSGDPADPELIARQLRTYLPAAEWEHAPLTKTHGVQEVGRRFADGVDVFFNLCCAPRGEVGPGIEVVEELERLGAAFTGAGSDFYEPSRERMKAACAAAGIDAPAWVGATIEADVHRAAGSLRFPLVVKHPCGYGSVGISRASRVETAEALHVQARRTMDAFGGALIEEFVEGREATVLVAEDPAAPGVPVAYPPIEYLFPAGETFQHYDLKWVDYRQVRHVPVAEEGLAAELRERSRRLFGALGGTGFARCDFRIDLGGRPWLLEINPNCGVYYPPDDQGAADWCLRQDPGGHAAFTRRLVEAALARRGALPLRP